MATRKIEVGPTGQRLATNIKSMRTDRRLRLDDLSRRLDELGRPIPKSGLSKIESGERRVDADDLTALAIALETNMNRLLLTEEAEDGDSLELTPEMSSTSKAAWAWACGEYVAFAGPWPWAKFAEHGGKPRELQRFQEEARPHDPPIWLSAEETVRLDPLKRAFDQIFFAMKDHDFTPDDFHTVAGMFARSTTTWSTSNLSPEAVEALKRGEIVMTVRNEDAGED